MGKSNMANTDYKDIYNKISYILWGDDLNRITVNKKNGELYISVDLHGFTCKKAYAVVTRMIRMFVQPFTLICIHGFHSGTDIKDMIWNKINFEKIQKKSCPKNNPGQTDIQLL